MTAAPTEQLRVPGAAPPPAPATPARSWMAVPSARVRGGLWWGTLLVAGVVCFVTFYAKGGLNLESMTSTEMALTLASGVTVAAAVLFGPISRRFDGIGSLGLLLAFTFLTALSVVWSVQPDSSWHDAGRMLAFSGVFAAALAIVRVAPDRWPALLGGLALAAAVVCGYALLTKIFPGKLAPENTYARLKEPFGYWNAIGLTAAMGAICCLWLGARRTGHSLLNALAYPAMGVMLLTLVLAYSRGAMAALAVGVVLWLCLVPLRLRGAAVLILGAVGAGAVGAWDFSNHALSAEKVPLAEQVTAGHQLGALVVAMVLVLAVAGLAIGFLTGRRAPSLAARRQAGTALLALITLLALGFVGALAHSHRGFTGSISHAFDALTNPNAKPPSNTPDRLTAVASVRARYWKEALQVFEAHPAVGAGAEGYATAHLRYRTETLNVRHAHGFFVQTLADLGLVGLVVSLALLFAWMAAAGRATHPLNRRWSSWAAWRSLRPAADEAPGESAGASEHGGADEGRPGWRSHPLPYTPERVGLLSMLCLVVVFGMHSLVDWTWYVPGNACVALLCAGWLAGRGASTAAMTRARTAVASSAWSSTAPAFWPRAWGWPQRASPTRALLAAAVVLAAMLAAWSQWQPQRSEDARLQAFSLLAAHNNTSALAAARAGVSRDALSAEALFTLASVENATGQAAAARSTLGKAVRLQPSNPQTWLELGRFDVSSNPRAALGELQAAVYLNPESISPEETGPPNPQPEAVEIYNDYVRVLRATRASSVRSVSGSRSAAANAATRAARRRAARRRARSRTLRPAG